jgi:hypothetical protein
MFKHFKTTRVLRAAAPLAIGLLAAAGVAGCASAGPYNPANLEPAQLGQVQQICRSVMGIPSGIGLSTDCVGNLSQSAVALRPGDAQGRALEAARQACLGKGLTPGDPSLSVCELSGVSDHASPVAGLARVRIDTAALEKPARSYFYASFNEVRRREQTACARLGYEPIDGRFAACVASLDAALFASEHPMQ